MTKCQSWIDNFCSKSNQLKDSKIKTVSKNGSYGAVQLIFVRSTTGKQSLLAFRTVNWPIDILLRYFILY